MGQMTGDSERFLIVGLGNPGREYKGNRHNIGFMAIDRLATAWDIPLTRAQARALVGLGQWAGRSLILAKPQTFMNVSGQAVGSLLRFYKIPLGRLLVMYDDLDLPSGALRLRRTGGAGGHNGMRSIIAHLGQEFPRLRLGIGRPPGRLDPAAFVLQDFAAVEQVWVNEVLEETVKAVTTFITEGLEIAMTRHNRGPAADAHSASGNQT